MKICSKFTQTNKVKQKVSDLLSRKVTKETVSDVQKYFKSFETTETHNSLLEMPMFKTECEQQKKWLVCKNYTISSLLMSNNGYQMLENHIMKEMMMECL